MDTAEIQRVEQEIQSDDLRTLAARAGRFLQIPRSHIIPMGPFAAPSAACIKLFRDAYFFGCITLAQAVTDAIIRHVDWIEFPDDDRMRFVRLPDRLRKLHEARRISNAVKENVERIWFHRNNFHHLDPKTQVGQAKLEEIAKLGISGTQQLTVGVKILNRAYLEFVQKHGVPRDEASKMAFNDSGAAALLLGKDAPEVPEGYWPGHLVVVVSHAFAEKHALLDPTITQADRPALGINLQPLCLPVNDDFVSPLSDWLPDRGEADAGQSPDHQN
jgi:hypothetical protein